ncbi:MAG: hypothetical protein EHM18_05430 [Acidobacteria bacterium]|nr:MAG: hypothetical protein EHM18_05430 [Acidobacteriota bacterium]
MDRCKHDADVEDSREKLRWLIAQYQALEKKLGAAGRGSKILGVFRPLLEARSLNLEDLVELRRAVDTVYDDLAAMQKAMRLPDQTKLWHEINEDGRNGEELMACLWRVRETISKAIRKASRRR